MMLLEKTLHCSLDTLAISYRPLMYSMLIFEFYLYCVTVITVYLINCWYIKYIQVKQILKNMLFLRIILNNISLIIKYAYHIKFNLTV